MKTGKIWIYITAASSVVLGLSIAAPLRANNNPTHTCDKQWVLTFPSGRGNTLYCAQFEDGSQRCSVNATDIPATCGNPTLRDDLLMLR